MANEINDIKTEKKQNFFMREALEFLKGTKKVRYGTIRETRRAIKDFIIYMIYLILTVVVTQRGNHDVQFFYNDAIQRSLSSEFTKVYNREIYLEFLEHTFMPLLQRNDFQPTDAASVYKNVNETWEYDEIFGNVCNRTLLHGNVFLGQPRLRQIRVPPRPCDRKLIFNRDQTECFGNYKWYNEDKADHQGYKWMSLSKDEALPIWGKFEIYWGAGYIINLNYSAEENLELIDRLSTQNWLDHRTALVVLEFSLYHVNTRLFHTAKFMAEQTHSGIYVPSIQLRSMRRESFFNESSLMIIALLVYYIIIIIMTIREIYLIKKMGIASYLFNLINFIDLTACIFSILMLILNIFHHFYVMGIVKRMSTSEQYINLDKLHMIDIILKHISGILMFLVCIHFLRFIGSNRSIVILWRVLHKCKHDIIGFLLLYIFILMAYASCGQVLFGGYDEQFRNGLTSVKTMLRCTVGDIRTTDSKGIWIYYISFIILVHMILLLCFRAIIIDTFTKIKKIVELSQSRRYETLYMYFRDFSDWLYFLMWRKRIVRPQLNIDARQESAEDFLIQEDLKIKDQPVLTQDEYLPKRLERARKQVNALKEVLPPVLERLIEYYNMLRKDQEHNEITINSFMENRKRGPSDQGLN